MNSPIRDFEFPNSGRIPRDLGFPNPGLLRRVTARPVNFHHIGVAEIFDVPQDLEGFEAELFSFL